MKLRLIGHDYRYAAEQIAMHAFPGEKPEFTREIPDKTLSADIKLTRDGFFVTASASIHRAGRAYAAAERERLNPALSAAKRNSLERRLMQKSFYRAAVLSGQTDIPWGSAAGIRPSTLLTKIIAGGADEGTAVRNFRREYDVTENRAALALDCAKAEIRAREAFGANDAALYIGIPFCPTRCAYCSFVSNSVEKSMKLMEPFLDALGREIGALAEAIDGTDARIACVYIGGGTPTALTAVQLDALMAKLGSAFDLSGVPEYTVEAGRPDTINAEKLAVMRAHGVTRVSVNPQTFDDGVLRAIGRAHTARDALDAFKLARDAGFKSLNMDLIAGLPSDTFEGFKRSLDAALELRPENITVHALSRKKGSRVTVEGIGAPGGEETRRMIDHSIDALRRDGYAPYYLYRQKYSSGGLENTGWTLLPPHSGYDGLYNIAMMDEALTVLALGGGGVTKLVSKGDDRIERIFNPKYPLEYTERIELICARKSGIREFLWAANPV